MFTGSKTKAYAAIFIGGFVTTLLLSLLESKGLAIALGFCVGCMAYAFPAVIVGAAQCLSTFIEGTVTYTNKTRQFLLRRHPFFYTALALTIWPSYYLFQTEISSLMKLGMLGMIASFVIVLTTWISAAAAIIAPVLALLAWIGSRYWDHCFWPFLTRSRAYSDDIERSLYSDEEAMRELEWQGLTRVKLTQLRAWGWMLKGLLLCIFSPFLLILLIPGEAHAMAEELFSCQAFLCGLYGASGGGLTYLISHQLAESKGDILAMCLIGGAVGVLLGKLHFERRQKEMPASS